MEYWALNEDGKLYIPGLTPTPIQYDTDNINIGTFYLNSNNKICADALEARLYGIPPFPKGIWYMRNDKKLRAGGIPERLYSSQPGPITAWNVVEDEITIPIFNQSPLLGAFANAEGLNTVLISQGLETIGEFSFRGTALESITLPQGCTYYDTSFPDGCVVNPDE